MSNSIYEPGILVQLVSQLDWGIGQVQSVLGEKVTVNFEHRGKVVLNIDRVELILLDGES
ncbi:MAG: DUF3553 domain-containing protein [Rhodobacteraceae bacterium]|mgnify:FL=1|jgi:hypothetical protein|nr:DUF3553 domain-containing protein [Paracoccaceae bacterium]MAT00167.1 DUF3553 domain-containing protein [Paracoccaceae bacterium]MBL6856735.1 DUF3553 domain-containing protein [Paracoccaceae bacterium]MBV04229.1 DUF3553 domain-containing protein [Paracoccaceae bacterium]MDG1878986.1 DUF3553 domain-containing protein [Paracoccaceae bacterium]|tara:strand:- start:6993 stop:7172 length:180 start_codon:yes stop_codon:yes gene_type:complete